MLSRSCTPLGGVGLEEGGAVARGPLRGPVGALLGLPADVDAAAGHRHHAGGVVERADHPGHVAPGRVGQQALGERLGRLALEVDDLPALDGAQGLAEVQVAVDLLDVDPVEVAEPAERLAQPGRRTAPGRARRRARRRAGPPSPSASASSAARRRAARPGSARPGRRAPRRARCRGGRPRRRSRRRPRRRAGRPRRTGCARSPGPGPTRRWRCGGTAGASRAGWWSRCRRPRRRRGRASRRARRRASTRPR